MTGAAGREPGQVWSVPAALHEERVDRAVALLTGLTRARVSDAVAAGQVRVAGRAVRRSRRVRAGERVDLDPAVLVPVDAPSLVADPEVSVAVVWEDPDVLVVDKPAGLVVHPGAGQRRGTLVQGLLARYPPLALLADSPETAARPGIVHRLDRGTSGLLVVARTVASRQSLAAQLAGHSVERRYLTLVWGAPEADEGLIDAPLGRSDRDPTLMDVRAGGRTARTHYRVLGRATEPSPVSLLECRLETGRTHQIRVHLASIGHPVVGDDRYGRRRRAPGTWPPLAAGRPFLHAGVLGFDHPSTGGRLRFVAALPADLIEVLVATVAPLGVPLSQ